MTKLAFDALEYGEKLILLNSSGTELDFHISSFGDLQYVQSKIQ